MPHRLGDFATGWRIEKELGGATGSPRFFVRALQALHRSLPPTHPPKSQRQACSLRRLDCSARQLRPATQSVPNWEANVYTYEHQVPDNRVESLFETAVYRFLELHTAPSDSSVSMHTEVRPSGLIKSVRLWSEGAVANFERHWRSFQCERTLCRPF